MLLELWQSPSPLCKLQNLQAQLLNRTDHHSVQLQVDEMFVTAGYSYDAVFPVCLTVLFCVLCCDVSVQLVDFLVTLNTNICVTSDWILNQYSLYINDNKIFIIFFPAEF